MRRLLCVVLLAGGLAGAPAVSFGQTVQFRILDEERLLRESELGQQILSDIRDAEQELEEENQRISDQLAEEERELTEARADMSPEEFRERADAFDMRVEAIRTERNQRSVELGQQSEAEAQRFFDTVLPVLTGMMDEQGLVALLKPDSLIIGVDGLDITDAAIERLDAEFGSGEETSDDP
ncbi:MAG: periplasmic chaperone for outer membrane proteins Skp [Rhodobacteraceae bacterium HLUCCA12]|nr:MAG: periplasmic chaperone for outer membrane proteins Skp [Rhodobacteraceae bacterium HLUCCA12]